MRDKKKNKKNRVYVIKGGKVDIETEDIKVDKASKKCAPHLNFDGHCAPTEVLKELAKAYNKEQEELGNDNRIIIDKKLETLNDRKFRLHLIKQLQDNMSETCGESQICWLKQDFIKKMNKAYTTYLKRSTYRPTGPANSDVWLNTINLMEVMEQYEELYKDFKFLGAVPLDFDKLDGTDGTPRLPVHGTSIALSNLDYSKLEEMGKTKFGIIFNLDKHNEPGSHWNGAYIDLDRGLVLFFDSYGTKPPPEIRKFMRAARRYMINNRKMDDKDITCTYSEKRHQFGNSECGVYSMVFIIRMLKGDTLEQINKKILKDETMQKECRDKYFRDG